MRQTLGAALAIVLRLWLWTLRVSLRAPAGITPGAGRPLVLAFWHGQQFALLRWPALRRLCVMVSWSADGDLQTGVMRGLGLDVVRGSSSRGGAAALGAVVRRLSAGTRDAAFAVDGPRGPLRRAKAGAGRAAELSGARIVPLACASQHVLVLGRAWDRFELPLPFSRVVIVAGTPVAPGPDLARRLEAAIESARWEAKQLLGSRAPRAGADRMASPS